MDPTMAAALKGVSQSDGGQILNVGNEILGYPVFTSTNVSQADCGGSDLLQQCHRCQ